MAARLTARRVTTYHVVLALWVVSVAAVRMAYEHATSWHFFDDAARLLLGHTRGTGRSRWVAPLPVTSRIPIRPGQHLRGRGVPDRRTRPCDRVGAGRDRARGVPGTARARDGRAPVVVTGAPPPGARARLHRRHRARPRVGRHRDARRTHRRRHRARRERDRDTGNRRAATDRGRTRNRHCGRGQTVGDPLPPAALRATAWPARSQRSRSRCSSSPRLGPRSSSPTRTRWRRGGSRS